MLKTVLYILLWLLPFCTAAQEFSYVHYNTADGLGGSTVYDACQDGNGFMWFATDNGLTRFDGTSFRNFTVQDGLPDNEVLRLYADSRGRMWIGTFNKDICCYYKGQFRTRHNDSTIARIRLNGNLTSVYEYSNGLVVLAGYTSITLVMPGGGIQSLAGRGYYNGTSQLGHTFSHGRVFFAETEANNCYVINADGSVSDAGQWFNKALLYLTSNPPAVFPLTVAADGTPRKSIRLPRNDVVSTGSHAGFFRFINTTSGAWETDTVRQVIKNHFLPGKRISRTTEDAEKNLWFCTFGDGVYKLSSTAVKTLSLQSSTGGGSNEVFTIAGTGGKILAGMQYSRLVITDADGRAAVEDFTGEFKKVQGTVLSNRLYDIYAAAPDTVLLGFDAFLYRRSKSNSLRRQVMPVKSMEAAGPGHIAAGTSHYVFRMDTKTLQITDTLWRERCTKVFFHNGSCYIGTINGLYKTEGGGTGAFLGSLHPTLSRRITGIKATPSGELWVASSDNGIVALKNGRITHVLKDTNGLGSNNCRTLFVQQDILWAGTSRGLCKINTARPDLPVMRYSSSDGLPSDIINAVYVQDSIVWVGTPAGLSWFNEANMAVNSICRLNLLGITLTEGKNVLPEGSFRMPWQNNSIGFSYAGVSFKSGGEISYYYRLNGLHSDWKQTQATSLNYQLLPPGSYELEMYAVNKFGLQSNTIKVPFFISTPYWKAWWFYVLLALLAASAIVLLMLRRTARQRRMLEEKNRVQQQFAALEQQALQAQMNPHFIFNCLNSIQQYNLTADKEKANEYLTGFASLVRQTLDYSGKRSITVAEEAAYLRQYLEMEKMRFGNNFACSVEVDESVKADFTELPALLLQPYVENALRHGIRYKENGQGRVTVHFTMEARCLVARVTDNGVGRRMAAALKSRQHIEYQSKGIMLTEKRVELLNMVNGTNMKTEINDLADAAGNAAGTEVIIKIPAV